MGTGAEASRFDREEIEGLENLRSGWFRVNLGKVQHCNTLISLFGPQCLSGRGEWAVKPWSGSSGSAEIMMRRTARPTGLGGGILRRHGERGPGDPLIQAVPVANGYLKFRHAEKKGVIAQRGKAVPRIGPATAQEIRQTTQVSKNKKMQYNIPMVSNSSACAIRLCKNDCALLQC
jgi:hypothetical protein